MVQVSECIGGGAEVGTKGEMADTGYIHNRHSYVVTVLVLLGSLFGNFILFIAIEQCGGGCWL